MLKAVTKTRRRTVQSATLEIVAIAAGCALVAGGVSAAEISMLNAAPAADQLTVEVTA